MGAFDGLVVLVTEILAARADDRDPTFVAVEVHTWIHGLVDLIANHPDGPWPPVESVLDDMVERLGLTEG
jgi:hypothetical protein